MDRLGVLNNRNEFFTEYVDTIPNIDDLESICLVLSSPCSGADVITRDMRNITDTFHLQGSHSPFYKLAAFYDFVNDNHELGPVTKDLIRKNIAFEMGEPILDYGKKSFSAGNYVKQIVSRLQLQLSGIIPIPPYETLLSMVRGACSDCIKKHGELDVKKMYVLLLSYISQWEPIAINSLHYYNIPPEYYSDHGIIGRENPIDDMLLEEPPLTTVEPFMHAPDVSVVGKTLVLHDLSDALRVSSVAKIFPMLPLKVVHVTRNPLRSINDIIDRWHQHHFYSCKLTTDRQLKTVDYAYKNFWNFTMPRGWEVFTQRNCKVMDIAAFQWSASILEIEKALEYSTLYNIMDYTTVKYEDYSEDHEAVMEHLAEFIGGEYRTPRSHPMWYASPIERREDEIYKLIQSKDIESISDHLGYHLGDIDSWI